MTEAICVENVFFRYPGAGQDTIQGVRFHVERGEIFGFLGPSGSGKSTLQRILTGVLRNYRGSVQVLGEEIKNRGKDYYQKIGVDFEFPNFYLKFTALENLRFFASLYGDGKSPAADPLPLLKRVGLLADADKKVGSFSKGMKMRLSFIRCLLHNPPLLYLDEPTSGLDPANARMLKDMILEQKEQGKTILLTTHNMHDAQELCDRVAFLVDGRIKALDTPCMLCQGQEEQEVVFRYHKDGNALENTCPLSRLGEDKAFCEALLQGALISIHSKEKTLEDVFLSLTGRCLQ